MTFLSTPLQIGTLFVKNRVFLAPLAGVSDIPFRRVCQEQGAGLTYVEMLSATAINYKNKRTFEMMARHESESILGVQVTGSSAADVAKAIELLSTKGFDTIDINMGCPVKKVVSAGCGSAILKDPSRVSETIQLAKQATSLPLSAKIRLGYTRDTVNVEENSQRVLLGLADMLTIHGRTRSESYSTPVDLKGLQSGVNAGRAVGRERAVIVGNGDVFDWKSAQAMVQQTQCDAVMVSRGALGNPWVFREILEGQTYHPSAEEWLDVVMNHLSYHEALYGPTRLAAILMRKHLLWYVKGFPGCKLVREKLNLVESLDDARQIVRDYASTLSADAVRFGGAHAEASENNQSDYDPKYEMDRKLDRGVGDECMESSQSSE